MFPELYQKILQPHLSTTQYLTLQALVLVLQSVKNVSLSKLVKAELVKPSKKRARLFHQGYLLLVIDRSQWKSRNVMMLSLVWGTHGLPVNWELLGKRGSSSLSEQKRILSPVLKWLKEYKVVVIGDREFHSAKLGDWLSSEGVDFILRQKKDAFIAENPGMYKSLEELEIRPGMSRFYRSVSCGKSLQLGPFNLAAYWKRKYRGKGPKEAWYILTSLEDMDLALNFYARRWSIETLFKDCKSGGYNLEQTQVNEQRLLGMMLIMVMAYTQATLQGIAGQKIPVNSYLARPTEASRQVARHSNFYLGCYGFSWISSFQCWSELAEQLMNSKAHKRYFYRQGLQALSLIQSTL